MAVLVAAYRGQRAQRHPGLPGRIGSALIADCLIVKEINRDIDFSIEAICCLSFSKQWPKRFEGGRVLS